MSAKQLADPLGSLCSYQNRVWRFGPCFLRLDSVSDANEAMSIIFQNYFFCYKKNKLIKIRTN